MKNAVPFVENGGVVYTEFNNGVPPRQTTFLGRWKERPQKEKWWIGLGVLLLVLVVIKLIITGIYLQMTMNRDEYLDFVKPGEE